MMSRRLPTITPMALTLLLLGCGADDGDAADAAASPRPDAVVADAAAGGDAGAQQCWPEDSAGESDGCFQTAAIGLLCQGDDGWRVMLRLGHGMGGCSGDVLPGVWHLSIPLAPPLADTYAALADLAPTLIWEESGETATATGGTLTFDAVPSGFDALEMPPNPGWAAGTIDMTFDDGTRVAGRFVADGCAQVADCEGGPPAPAL